MATATSKLNARIQFEADSRGMVREVQRANAQLKKMSTQLARTRHSQNRLNNSMRRFTSSLAPMVAGLGGAAVGLQQVVQQVFAMDAALTKVQFLVGITTNEMKKLEDGVISVSSRSGRSLSQVSDALFDITSAGFRGAQAISTLGNAADGAVLGLGTVKQLADAMTNSMAAWSSSNLTSQRTLTALWAGVREGKAQGQSFARLMSDSGALAAQLGVQIEQLAGLFAHLTKSMDEATARTRIKGILSAIVKPSQQARDVLAQFGLTAQDIGRQVDRGLLGALQQLRTVLGDENLSKFFRSVQGFSGTLSVTNNNYSGAAATVSAVQATTSDQTQQAISGASGSLQNRINILSRPYLNALVTDAKRVAGPLLAVLETFEPLLELIVDMAGDFSGMGGAGKLKDHTLSLELRGQRLYFHKTPIPGADKIGQFPQLERKGKAMPDFRFFGPPVSLEQMAKYETALQYLERVSKMTDPQSLVATGDMQIINTAMDAERGRRARERNMRSLLVGGRDLNYRVRDFNQRQQAQRAGERAQANRQLQRSYAELWRTMQGMVQVEQRHLNALGQARGAGVIEAGIFGADLQSSMREQLEVMKQRNLQLITGKSLTQQQIFLESNLRAVRDEMARSDERMLSLRNELKFANTDQQRRGILQRIAGEQSYRAQLQSNIPIIYESAKAVGQMSQAWRTVSESRVYVQTFMQSARSASEDFTLQFISGQMSAAEAAKGFVRTILIEYQKMMIVKPFFDQIFGGLNQWVYGSGLGVTPGGWLAGLFGGGKTAAPAHGGSVYAVGGRQYGGNVLAGQSYLIGERGTPQVFTPHVSGGVSANGMSGGVTVKHEYRIIGSDASTVRRVLTETEPARVQNTVSSVIEVLQRPGPQRQAVIGV